MLSIEKKSEKQDQDEKIQSLIHQIDQINLNSFQRIQDLNRIIKTQESEIQFLRSLILKNQEESNGHS